MAAEVVAQKSGPGPDILGTDPKGIQPVLEAGSRGNTEKAT